MLQSDRSATNVSLRHLWRAVVSLLLRIKQIRIFRWLVTSMTMIPMKTTSIFRTAFCVSFLVTAVASAAAEPKEIPLWPNGAPGSEGKTAKEVVATSSSGEHTVWSIHNPSLTPYLQPTEKATGTALLVIPGGGHRNLAIDHEGYIGLATMASLHSCSSTVWRVKPTRLTRSTSKRSPTHNAPCALFAAARRNGSLTQAASERLAFRRAENWWRWPAHASTAETPTRPIQSNGKIPNRIFKR